MTFVRALGNPDASMQRVGFLKYLVWRCSLANALSLDLLGKDLINNCTKTQSLYLASEMLPSHTGKLIPRDWRGYPYFTSSLGFVRKGTYSLLVRGKVFLELVSQEELKAFNNYNPEVNPLAITTEQRGLLLYCFIENDGDVLKRLFERLLALNRIFTEREAGDFLPEIYRPLVKLYRPKIRSGIDAKRLDKLARSADNIEIRKGKNYTGKTHAITPRLEPFVDLGLLKKQDPHKYEYCFTEQGQEFFTSFCSSEDMGEFLNDSFFSTLDKSFKPEGSPAKKTEIMEALFAAFNTIKSPLGYAPIKEIALLGAIRLLTGKRKCFEIGQATKLIMEYQKIYPYKARFQVDRSGAPVYIKFLTGNKNNNGE